MVMEYPPKKRYWPVILDVRVKPNTTVEVCTGWNKFRQENGLEEGKIYMFEFNHEKNVIKVKECKKNGELDSNEETMWRFSVELKHHHFKGNRMVSLLKTQFTLLLKFEAHIGPYVFVLFFTHLSH